ncbi:odorant receptor 22c-like isoform X10 [Leptopilina boulardi]|uniref:odorant receptor 22c-like isoform X10 n=1 Tax=Leptopilina boulardi TaxID=63433 RepID=UPI0021F5B866|nr:odorant receptor 22c-like isoform X10 [Leptopilina boulardi]
MDIVKNPYYNIIRYVIILTGQSQYHSKWLNIWIKSLFFLVILSFIITQLACSKLAEDFQQTCFKLATSMLQACSASLQRLGHCKLAGNLQCKSTASWQLTCVLSGYRYVNDVQSVFSTAYLFVFGLSIIDLSITGVQSVMSKNNPEEAIRFGFYTMCQVFHIFLLTLPPQQLLDSSLSLPIYIYNTDWYYLSTETKKMLLLIMKRGSQPTTFIVGKIFIPSLQFFTKVLQTSLSYFTVLISVRG